MTDKDIEQKIQDSLKELSDKSDVWDAISKKTRKPSFSFKRLLPALIAAALVITVSFLTVLSGGVFPTFFEHSQYGGSDISIPDTSIDIPNESNTTIPDSSADNSVGDSSADHNSQDITDTVSDFYFDIMSFSGDNSKFSDDVFSRYLYRTYGIVNSSNLSSVPSDDLFLSCEYFSVPAFCINLVGSDNFDAWVSEVRKAGKPVTISAFISEFNISQLMFRQLYYASESYYSAVYHITSIFGSDSDEAGQYYLDNLDETELTRERRASECEIKKLLLSSVSLTPEQSEIYTDVISSWSIPALVYDCGISRETLESIIASIETECFDYDLDMIYNIDQIIIDALADPALLPIETDELIRS